MMEEATPPDAPRRRGRRIGRFFAIFGLSLVVLIAAALLFLHTSPARRFVISQVTSLLQAQNISFNTDELRYNLLDLRLTLRNVEIRSQDAPDLPPFARIDRISADLSLTRLLRRRYVLQSGEAQAIDLHYFVDATGRDNLPRPPSDPKQTSEPLDYLIERLRIKDARVRYENRAQRIDVAVPVHAIEVDGNALTDRHTVRLDAGKGSLAIQDRKATLDWLRGELDLGEDDARLTSVEVAAEGARVHVTGTIVQFADPHADLAVRGNVDVARAAAVAALNERVDGVVDADVRVKGRIATPTVEGRVNAANLTFRNLSDLQLAATAAYDMLQKRATISSLDVRAPFGAVNGRGVLAMTPGERSELTATVAALDLAAVMRAFELPYIVASRVDAQVNAAWPAMEYLQAAGDATATLTPSAGRAGRSTIPAGGRIDLTGRASAVDAVVTRLTAAGAEVNGRLRIVNQRDLSGTAEVRVGDLARTVTAAEAILGQRAGSLVPVRVAGSLQATTRVGGTVTAPSVNARVTAPALTLGTASGLSVAGDVGYTPAQVAVRDLLMAWQQARVQAAGTVGLTGARRLDLTFTADALDVAELLRAAEQPQVPATGTLALAGRVGGTTAQPLVDATVNGTDLVAYNETWGTLVARINMARREVVVSELALTKPQPQGDGRLAGTASYHLDRRTYTADLQSQNVQLLSLTLPDGRPVRGTLQVNARGEGSVEAPAGTLSLAADRLQIAEYTIGQVTANATVANQQANITAAVPAYALAADARIGVQQPYPMTAKVRVEDLQLAALPVNLKTPLEGQLRATVDATGNLAGGAALTQSLQATARIDAFAGAWNGQPFSIDAPAVLRYAKERLAIDQLRLVAQDSTVAVAGELPINESGTPGAITLDARANLATLARYAPADTSITAAGALTLNGTVRGTLKAIDPDLTLVVSEGAVSTPQLTPGLTNINLRTTVANGEATIEQLNANFGPAQITANGRVPLEVVPQLPVDIPRRGGPATLTASVQGLDLAQMPGVPRGLTGRISLEAKMAASRADVAALEGQIVFPELQVGFGGLTLAQQEPSTISLAGGVARIDRFALSGSVGTLAASGTVALTGERPLDVAAKGNLNVAVISLFTDAVRAEGETVLDVRASGTVAAPELDGFVDMKNATFVLDEPTVAAEDVTARLDLSGRRISVAQLTGTLNGGALKGSGFVELGAGGIADAALELTTDDVAFDAPLDLRSLSDARVRLAKRGDEFVVEGQITLDEAGLTGDINFDEGLLAAMQSRRRLDLTEQRNEFLERVRFNLDIDTATPILVDNNLARAEVSLDLRLLGTPYEPGLSGRLTVSDESEIMLNERRYEVERGVITFIGERRILPSFDLTLNTTARNYDVTLTVSGMPGDTETTLTSDPPLPEPDIMALLVTGRTLDEMRGEEFEVAREQVLSYLAGRVGSQLGRGIARATGFDRVRVEPQLIANEADPTARLTITEDIADEVELIYSTSLTDTSDQIWVVEYDVTRRFQTRGVRQSDNSYRFDIHHDVRIGGRPAPRRQARQRPRIAAVTVKGDGRIPEAELRQLLGVETGDEYNFFEVRDAVEEIEEELEERGHLQSRVRLQRQLDAQSVALTLTVTAGPRVDLVFEGATPPRKIADEVRTKWRRGVFDTQRLDDGVEVLQGWLMDDNYLQPKVEGTIAEVSPAHRTVRLRIEPGVRYTRVVLAFEGAAGIEADELRKIIKEQDLERQLFTDPTQVTELLERYYREQGYLVADVADPAYEFAGSQARVVLRVAEGPRFITRNVTASGVSVLPTDVLIGELPVRSGDPFLPFAAENALEHIRTVYWRRGYNDVRSDYALTLDRDQGHLDVAFEIEEGPQSVVAEINIEGNEKTSNRLVREQLALAAAQPLDLSALARSRRNLYETRAFSVVDIRREEANAVDGRKPVTLNVSIREVQPIQLRYGMSYDTERGLGGLFDVSNHNSLGKARVVGVRGRYDGQVREGRAYMSQPSLRYWPIQTTGSVYYRVERNRATERRPGRFDIDRRGVSIQQERELGNSYVWNWGYRYERAHSFDPTPGGVLDELLTVSPLTSTFTRETRDEVLDATRGSFSSHAFSYSPSWLGADQGFMKYLGQYFHYIPLEPERRERFTNEILRPRFVYAVGVRLGLAKGFGNVVPRSERFFAGGSTTMRGFEQNAVGPIDARGLPLGGDAMLVINNELRVPLLSIFDGVVFSDLGNVFPLADEFSFSDLRKTAGVGLRARTRWFLLRGDYGFLLDRRAGEPRGRFYFSLGQAF
jgi:outer membrane protein assembly complex protein YaeT